MLHAGMLNRVYWMQAAHPLNGGDVVAFKTSTCFVDHLWELFAPLLLGIASNPFVCCVCSAHLLPGFTFSSSVFRFSPLVSPFFPLSSFLFPLKLTQLQILLYSLHVQRRS